MWKFQLILISLLFVQSFAEMPKYGTKSPGYIRGCYYTNWAQYRPGRGLFKPENYPPGLCTHLFYAFAVMNEQFSVIPFEWNDESTEWSKGMFERVVDLKKMQPDLKILLSFGGWVFSQGKQQLFRQMLDSSRTRKTFIQSAIQITKKHKFDGFDLDYEYPEAEDKENFSLLLRELSSALRNENLMFTAAVAAGIARIEPGYDIPTVAETLDFVNIMTYDMHGGWESVTGLNSPLYDRNGDLLSVSNAAEYWETHGLPKNKIVVGFPTYGRAWTLTNPSETGIGSPAGQATAGPFTREAGFLSYYEIQDMISSGSGQRFFDDQQKTPYMVKDSLWVGYDDLESFEVKVAWLKQKGYGGAFAWSLDLDDFNGQSSGGKKYPLISYLSTQLGGKATGSNVTQPGSNNVVTRPPPVSSNTVPPAFRCPSQGLYPDPASCSRFYNCGSNRVANRHACGQGLQFNPISKVCDWKANVRCVAPRRNTNSKFFYF